MDSGGINYNFSHFDDEVGKEPGDLTVDSALTSAGSSTLTTTHSQSVLSHQELADISQVYYVRFSNVLDKIQLERDLMVSI